MSHWHWYNIASVVWHNGISVIVRLWPHDVTSTLIQNCINFWHSAMSLSVQHHDVTLTVIWHCVNVSETVSCQCECVALTWMKFFFQCFDTTSYQYQYAVMSHTHNTTLFHCFGTRSYLAVRCHNVSWTLIWHWINVLTQCYISVDGTCIDVMSH